MLLKSILYTYLLLFDLHVASMFFNLFDKMKICLKLVMDEANKTILLISTELSRQGNLSPFDLLMKQTYTGIMDTVSISDKH